MEDIRLRLSVLWLFATLNYIYADCVLLHRRLGVE